MSKTCRYVEKKRKSGKRLKIESGKWLKATQLLNELRRGVSHLYECFTSSTADNKDIYHIADEASI